MPPAYIYTLRDPRTQDVRYVGSTVNPEARKEDHCLRPQAEVMKHWVTELSAINLEPLFEVIEETTVEDRGIREYHWIMWYGHHTTLLNTTHTQRARVIKRQPRGPIKHMTSYRLTPVALSLLAALADTYGLNNSDMLEIMIREKARQDGFWHPTAERKDSEL